MQDIKKCSTWTCTQTITGQLLALNLFVWQSFQYFFVDFFIKAIKNSPSKNRCILCWIKMCKHIVGCITKQQIVVLSGFSCSLRFLCDFCWFVSVARKHCWLSLMNMMKKGKKKVCKSGSCNNLRNAIWNYFYTKNRQKQGWSECNKCTTFFYIKYKFCLASDLKTVGNWNEIGYATPLEMIYLALMLME